MMRKSVFLTLLIALFGTAAAWAEFNPTAGVKYALQENSSGLYLDIQTLGFGNHWEGADNISLSAQPCGIYFEAGQSGRWKMKNTDNQYVYVGNPDNWNPRIGHNGESGYEWIFSESGKELYTIAWEVGATSYRYVHMDEPTANAPLWCSSETPQLEFSLVRYEAPTGLYSFHINAPQGENVTVWYDGEEVYANQTFAEDVDAKLFTATDIDGYIWEIVVNRANYTITLVYTQVVQGSDEFNGYYHIYCTNGTSKVPLFIGYNTEDDLSGDDYTGYKILGEGIHTIGAEADKIFAIVPVSQGDGYTIAAQGKSLSAPNFDGWNHVQFSDENAGVYLFHETDLAGAFKIQGVGGDGLEDWVHNDYLQVYNVYGSMIVGPNPENSASAFTIVPATSYTVTIPESGYLPLCLPFNVVLPEGVEACDMNNLSEEALVKGEGLLVKIAGARNILKAGTPVILQGDPGVHAMGITMSDEGAITSLAGSVLRGNYVNQILKLSFEKKRFMLHGEVFEAIMGSQDIPANSCWVEAEIEDNEIDLEPNFIEIGDWKFRVKESGKGIEITDCVEFGSGHLEIGPFYTVNGVSQEVIAIADDFLHDCQDLTEVTLPYTLTSVGESHANYMFDITYSGPERGKGQGIGVPAEGKDAVAEAESWIGTAHDCRYKVLGTSTWRMTVDVRLSVGDLEHFNEFGSCLFATKENTLSNNYNDGSMQLYLRADKGIVLKLDQTGDTYMFNNPANLPNLPNGTQYVGDAFTFVLENDGAGGYITQMVYGDGTVEAFEITAADHAELHDFNTIWSSLGKGIEVNVEFEKLTNRGLFVGCKNLTTIHVHEDNPSFTGCDHGVLYNKAMTHVIRFPEGGGHVVEDCGYEENGHRHFETPRTVTMVYAGALHGVNAHIVFHSNPLIMHVEGHEDHMIAKYHLLLDDDEEVIDFVTANANTFETFHYRRPPLAEGKFGTVMLPFVPENAQQKYEFFELLNADGESIFFAKVADGALQANVPYLYRLLDGKGDVVLGGDPTIDEFISEERKRIEDVGYNVPIVNGDWESVGCYNKATKEVGGERDTYYGVNQGNLVRVATRFHSRPYRAYYKLKGAGAAAPAKLILRMLDGGTTEITPAQIEGWEEPVYYDLMGRRVLNPTSGVYIVNGKKMVL